MAQLVIEVSDDDFQRTIQALSEVGGYDPQFHDEPPESTAMRMVVMLIRNTVVNHELAKWQASQSMPQSTSLILPPPID